jgi:hypothetical protein
MCHYYEHTIDCNSALREQFVFHQCSLILVLSTKDLAMVLVVEICTASDTTPGMVTYTFECWYVIVTDVYSSVLRIHTSSLFEYLLIYLLFVLYIFTLNLFINKFLLN